MSDPPAYVRRYLTDHERRYAAPSEKPTEPVLRTLAHPGVEALIALAHEQARDTAQDQHLSDLIRGLLGHRPDLAIDGTHGRRP